MTNNIYKFFMLCMYTSVYALSGSSTTVVSSASASTTSTTSTDTIVLIVTLISGLLTILVVAAQAFKSNKDPEIKLNKTTSPDVMSHDIELLQKDLTAVQMTVNIGIDQKLKELSKSVVILEEKLKNLDINFDRSLQDKKDENKEARYDISTLREYIREEMKDVRSLIMDIIRTITDIE